jgi:hypothetical protein
LKVVGTDVGAHFTCARIRARIRIRARSQNEASLFINVNGRT